MKNNNLIENMYKIFSNSRNPVYLINTNYEIIFVNNQITKIFGDIKGKKCFEILHNKNKPCSNCIYKEANRTFDVVERVYNEELSFFNNAKSVRKVCIPINFGEEYVYIIIIINNIKELIEIEERENEIEALKESVLLNSKISIEKVVFYTNLIHELSRSMNNMEEVLEIFKGKYPFFKESEEIQIINNILNIGNNTIHKLMVFNKVNKVNDLTIEKTFDFSKLFLEIKKRYTMLAKNRNVKFSMNLSYNNNNKYIGDRAKIKQIVSNILDNSFDFTMNGTIILDVLLIEENTENSIFRIVVKDSGIGIPKDQIDYVIKRFKTGKNCPGKIFSKIGLGLSISDKLIKSIDGELDIKSDLGVGTEVIMKIPIKKKVISELSSKIYDDSLKIKVLIIGINELYEYFLKFKFREKYIVKKVSKGDKGLLAFYDFKPDIVVIDIMTDIINGFDFYDEIEKKQKKIPIIITSNRVLDSEEEYLKNYGFDAYISRPLNYRKLEKRIDSLLGKE